MQLKSSIQGIIFDMDGVLCDSEPFIAEAAGRMFAERHALTVKPEDFRPFIGMGEDRFLGGVAEKYGVALDMPADKDRTYAIYLDIIRGRLHPLPGVVKFIADCRQRGLKLAVATSADRIKLDGNLREIGLSPDMFNACVTGNEVRRKKPSPDIFLTAARKAQMTPAETLVIEDAPNGIQAAKAADMLALGITSSFSAATLKATGADWTAPDLAHVPEDLKLGYIMIAKDDKHKRSTHTGDDMNSVRIELVRYGIKIVQARLVAGAGGNISARDDDIIWMKPSGLALDEMTPSDLCGMDLKTGRQVKGKRKPTSEVNMHLAIYRARADVNAVFHTHSPWASGVITAGITLRPMFAEFVNDLGRTGTVPYVTPTTQRLAEIMGNKARTCDTIFMVNHGVLAVGATQKQAYFRVVVVEDAAKSLVAASVVGRPRFLTRRQAHEILSLDAVKHRTKMVEAGG